MAGGSSLKFTPKEGDAVQLSTQLGALTLKGFLAQPELSEQQLTTALNAYKGDSLTITTVGEKSATTTWTVNWNSESSATTFHQQAQEIISSLPTPPTLVLEGLSVTLSVTEPLARACSKSYFSGVFFDFFGVIATR